jgi:acyl homoserine lactone synthase
MILAVLPEDRARYAAELYQMHQLRYRVFHERLGWEVTTAGDSEFDRFDTLKPIYLLHLDADGQVTGCARLLPSTGPTMVRDVFPVLLGGAKVPSDPLVWEASRFAADATGDAREQMRMVGQITIKLFAGLCELGLAMGWRRIVAVTDLRLEKVGARAGLHFERYAAPRQIGKTRAVAGFGEVNQATLDAVRAFGGLTQPVLRFSSDPAPARIAA